MSNTPSWLKEEENKGADTSKARKAETVTNSSAAAAAPSSSNNTSNSDGAPIPPFKRTVRALLSLVDLGLGVMMGAVGVLGIQNAEDAGDEDDSNSIFLGGYMVVFAAILILYELVTMCRISFVDRFLKNNVGFMYSVYGRGAYMMFIAIICFSINDPKDLAIATGCCVGAMGLLQIVLYFIRPGYFQNEDDNKEDSLAFASV